MLIFFLCAFSLLAGFIDSVVGGGGLNQIPAMLILLLTYDWPTILPAATWRLTKGAR